MTMQMPKWKTFTLESYEIPHIYKEPTKAVFTNKRDKISEADVQWMTRPDGKYSDPTRINEKITVYPKGVDPVAKVKYGTNPYKLEVIRIPELAAEQLVALSRPRLHQNKAVNTNPGIRISASVVDINNKIDLFGIKKITSKEKVLTQLQPNLKFRIDYTDPNIFRLDQNNKAIDKNNNFYSITANKVMKISQPENGSYVDDKIAEKPRMMNIQASMSKPTEQVINPDIKLINKQDLQEILSKQVFRKDDIMSSMDSGVELNLKQIQQETMSRPTITNLSTPIMNTDVPTVNRIEKEEMMANRIMGVIPRVDVRQEYQTLKDNNKGNISFTMQMYNHKDFPECPTKKF